MKITVLVKQPGKRAHVRTIENALDAFQEIVGGNIEQVPLMYDVLLSHIPDICALCNDSGKINNMKANFLIGNILNGCYDVICGPVIFAGVDGDEIVSLTERQIALIQKSITANEVIAI